MDLMTLEIFPSLNDSKIYEATGSKRALHRAVACTDLVQSQGWAWWHSLVLRAGFRHCVGHGLHCHAIHMSHSAGTSFIALELTAKCSCSLMSFCPQSGESDFSSQLHPGIEKNANTPFHQAVPCLLPSNCNPTGSATKEQKDGKK